MVEECLGDRRALFAACGVAAGAFALIVLGVEDNRPVDGEVFYEVQDVIGFGDGLRLGDGLGVEVYAHIQPVG